MNDGRAAPAAHSRAQDRKGVPALCSQPSEGKPAPEKEALPVLGGTQVASNLAR